jgi:conjugative transposon TraM protein
MKQVTHTQVFLRKRKMLLVLPLMALPFITLAFWALGGGKTGNTASPGDVQGLNLQLPGTQLKGDSTMTKLSFYEKARSDSEKRREWLRSDPYFTKTDTALSPGEREGAPVAVQVSKYPGYDPAPLNPSPYDGKVTSAEEKVMQKLAQLNEAMQNGDQTSSVKGKEKTSSASLAIGSPNFGSDIDRLEAMMQGVGNKGGEDPELEQLSNMMDRILDIQHPERVRERTRETSVRQREAIFPVQVEQPTLSISLLGGDTLKKSPDPSSSRFFGLEDDLAQTGAQASVPASVHGTQTLSSGSVVKLRLEQNIYVGGQQISKGSFIYGTAEINGERLHISITSIRSGVAILPVKLQVYDLDAIEGIYMPGSVQREVVKNSTDNALQGLGLSTIDPTLKAKAASAGISAAKNLLSRKVKTEKVTLKGGYQVILQSLSN